ncbi:uncharacterized protein YicC (UPF0701 family) [Microbacter margulisiae]|uniref:Uncharacterized protein YicC (UPF0701 family) n=1 Tax=Microbacter margulisiae TaxID=1350067 RepID=A0A7W5DP30_9PORP|nr:uncharacterized protein YicC (UPF0701 family) [Microbacter margulisiae]
MAEIESHVLNEQYLNRYIETEEKVKKKFRRGKNIEAIKILRLTGNLQMKKLR